MNGASILPICESACVGVCYYVLLCAGSDLYIKQPLSNSSVTIIDIYKHFNYKHRRVDYRRLSMFRLV